MTIATFMRALAAPLALVLVTALPAPAFSQAANDEVVFVDGTKSSPMLYANVQMRTAARGMGFGGFGQYAVLPGPAAVLRTTNQKPTFIVAIPENAQPQGYCTVASFAKRPNNTREVSIGGGYMSYSSGIIAERIMPTISERNPDQSRAPKGTTLYKITPQNPLAAGEYAFIVNNSGPAPAGPMMGGGAFGRYFDFGID